MLNKIEVTIDREKPNTNIAFAVVLEAVAKDIRENCSERVMNAHNQGSCVRRTIHVEYVGKIDFIIY